MKQATTLVATGLSTVSPARRSRAAGWLPRGTAPRAAKSANTTREATTPSTHPGSGVVSTMPSSTSHQLPGPIPIRASVAAPPPPSV